MGTVLNSPFCISKLKNIPSIAQKIDLKYIPRDFVFFSMKNMLVSPPIIVFCGIQYYKNSLRILHSDS